MSNRQFGGWRLRIFDSNGQPFEEKARLHFYDTSLTTEKDVYADADNTVSLGSIIELDSEGYVPVSGIWPASGAYSVAIEVYSYTDTLNVDHYDVEYTIPYLSGSDIFGSGDDDGLSIYTTVVAMLASETTGYSYCYGYNDIGDGGGGFFSWDSTNADTADSGSILQNSNFTTGRYLRNFENNYYSIKQWGATENIVNVTLFITRAVSYANSNDCFMHFPLGTYNLADEDITLDKHCVIEDGCFFDGTGAVTFDGCNIESTHKLSNNSLFANTEYLKPEWFGAGGDGVANDNYELYITFNKAVGYGIAVKLTNSYLLNDVWPIDATGISTIVEEGASIIIGSSQTGIIDFNRFITNSIGFISGTFTYLTVFDGLRSSHFASITDSGLIELLNNTSLVNFIFDSSIAITTVHSGYDYVNFTYESGFKLLIGSSGSFELNNDTMYFEMFEDFDTIGRLTGTYSLTARDNTAGFELSSNIAFNADVTIKDCLLLLPAVTDIALSNLYHPLYFDNVQLDSGSSNTTLYISSTNTTLNKITTDDVDLCLVTNSETLGYFLSAKLRGVTFNSGALLYVTSTGADAECNLDIQYCKLYSQYGIISNVSGTGATWVNDSTSHNVVIKNNTCATASQCITTELKQTLKTSVSDTYVPNWQGSEMTTAQYTGVDIESSLYLFVLYGNTEAPIVIKTHSAMAELWTDSLSAWVANQPIWLYSSKGYGLFPEDSSTIVYSDLDAGKVTMWRTPMQLVSGFGEVYMHHTYTISTYK